MELSPLVAASPSVGQEIYYFYGTQGIITMFTRAHSLPALSQMNPVYTPYHPVSL